MVGGTERTEKRRRKRKKRRRMEDDGRVKERTKEGGVKLMIIITGVMVCVRAYRVHSGSC